MQILFADPALRDAVQATIASDACFGPLDAGLIRQRLCELIAADTLAVAAAVPTLEISTLDSRPDEFTARVRPGLHLRFVLAEGSPIREAPDFAQVTAIRILAIEEAAS